MGEAGTESDRDILKEQLRWLRVIGGQAAKELLTSVLLTEDQRRAYEACDGKRIFRQIAEEVGVSHGSVSGWSQRWRALGLAFENDNGRIERLVSLEELGIPIDPAEDEPGN